MKYGIHYRVSQSVLPPLPPNTPVHVILCGGKSSAASQKRPWGSGEALKFCTVNNCVKAGIVGLHLGASPEHEQPESALET